MGGWIKIKKIYKLDPLKVERILQDNAKDLVGKSSEALVEAFIASIPQLSSDICECKIESIRQYANCFQTTTQKILEIVEIELLQMQNPDDITKDFCKEINSFFQFELKVINSDASLSKQEKKAEKAELLSRYKEFQAFIEDLKDHDSTRKIGAVKAMGKVITLTSLGIATAYLNWK